MIFQERDAGEGVYYWKIISQGMKLSFFGKIVENCIKIMQCQIYRNCDSLTVTITNEALKC